MKNVRLFYKKTGNARFVSHLDTMRFMTRLLRRANLPVWYTEGFNQHLYITFALPLSLGMTSEYEIADIRLTDGNVPLENICDVLNSNSTPDFYFFSAAEPQNKPADLTFAKFVVSFEDGGKLAYLLESFMGSKEIMIEKKTKKGETKLINAAEDIVEYRINNEDNTKLSIILPAGNNKNVNPDLIIKKFLSQNQSACYYEINRVLLLDSNKKPLK